MPATSIPTHFLVLDRSRIQANAAVRNGGRITIDAGTLIRAPDSELAATRGTQGVAGQIAITAAEQNLAGDLAELPATFLVSERLFEQSWAARSGEPVSSVVSAGRGGLPADPERPLSGLYLADQTTEGSFGMKQPSTRAGDELPAAAVELAPVGACLECDG